MLTEIIGAILGSGLISTIATYLVNRKMNQAKANKTDAEAAKTDAQAQEIYAKVYQRLVKDLNDQIEALKKEVNEVHSELARVRRYANNLVKRLKKYEEVKEEL